MCANAAGGLLLVGSADGSLTLCSSKLDANDTAPSHVAVHDMWAGNTQDLITHAMQTLHCDADSATTFRRLGIASC